MNVPSEKEFNEGGFYEEFGSYENFLAMAQDEEERLAEEREFREWDEDYEPEEFVHEDNARDNEGGGIVNKKVYSLKEIRKRRKAQRRANADRKEGLRENAETAIEAGLRVFGITLEGKDYPTDRLQGRFGRMAIIMTQARKDWEWFTIVGSPNFPKTKRLAYARLHAKGQSVPLMLETAAFLYRRVTKPGTVAISGTGTIDDALAVLDNANGGGKRTRVEANTKKKVAYGPPKPPTSVVVKKPPTSNSASALPQSPQGSSGPTAPAAARSKPQKGGRTDRSGEGVNYAVVPPAQLAVLAKLNEYEKHLKRMTGEQDAKQEAFEKKQLAAALAQAEEEASRKKGEIWAFKCSKIPKERKLFDRPDCEVKAHDMKGDPFCGYVCIAASLGKVPDYHFLDSLSEQNNGILLDMGGMDSLRTYGASLGVNVAFDVRGDRKFEVSNDKWRWVILVHSGPLTHGHWSLGVGDSIDTAHVTQPTWPSTDRPANFWEHMVTNVSTYCFLAGTLIFYHYWRVIPWYLGVFVLYGMYLSLEGMYTCSIDYTVKGPYFHDAVGDKRVLLDRRDRIESEDTYYQVSKTDIFECFYGPLYSVTVSGIRYDQLCREGEACLAAGRDPELAVPTAHRLRGVNTRGDIPVILGTIVVYRDYMAQLKEDPLYLGCQLENMSGMVMVNTPGGRSHFSKKTDREVIEANQIAGLGGDSVNHIKLKPNAIMDEKKNVQVAVAPFGPIITSRGKCDAGYVAVSDTVSRVAGMTGRQMTKEWVSASQLEEFLEFSKKILDEHIDSAPVDELIEVSPEVFFADHFRGRKSEATISKACNDYVDHLSGVPMPASYFKHTNFTKFEANHKNGEARPRLICVMSPHMQMETCQVLSVIHAWNAGSFAKYQVKDLTSEEMIEKIIDNSDGWHTVTDYSAFESSLSPTLRALENYAMDRLLERAGFTETRRAVAKYVSSPRVMHFKGGKFVNHSRNSGDPWTSFGNGLISYCAIKWGSRHLNRDVRLIVEGDDGLVEGGVVTEELVAELGLKFSSALSGNKPGDCDMLRSRWVGGRRYLSIGRTLANGMWIKKAAKLSVSKQKYLIRCMAASIHHLSPGHPVLAAFVHRVGCLTSGATDFKGSSRFLDSWKFAKGFKPGKFPDYHVDESMRQVVADGASGFPPISVSDQLTLEERLLDLTVHGLYVGTILDGYEEVENYLISGNKIQPEGMSDDMKWVINMLRTTSASKPK